MNKIENLVKNLIEGSIGRMQFLVRSIAAIAVFILVHLIGIGLLANNQVLSVPLMIISITAFAIYTISLTIKRTRDILPPNAPVAVLIITTILGYMVPIAGLLLLLLPRDSFAFLRKP